VIKQHSYVRKTEGALWESEVVSVYSSRNGTEMAVVEIVAGPFKGMQHIYKQKQLIPSLPSKAMLVSMMDEGMAVPERWHGQPETPTAPLDYELYDSTDVFEAHKGGLKR